MSDEQPRPPTEPTPQGPPQDQQYPQYPTQPAYAAHQPQSPYAVPPPSKTKATWALVTACLPCGISLIASVVLSIIVLIESRHGQDHGKKRAIIALCIVGAWVVLLGSLVAIAIATDPERDESGTVVEGGSELMTDLTVGDCLPDVPKEGDTTTLVDVVPCSESHVGEVYWVYDLDEYTTREEVDAAVQKVCADRFEPYLGVAYEDSTLDVYYYRPLSKRAFDDDPGASCIVFVTEARTSSIKGAGAEG